MKQPLKQILSIGKSFWDAQILLTAANLNVFDVLKEATLAKAAAEASNTDEAATVMLLDALSSMGVLDKNNKKYKLKNDVAPYLLSSSPKNVLSILNHYYFMYDDWGRLKESLVSGKAIKKKKKDRNETYEFIRGMDNLTKFYKDRVVEAIDYAKAKTILDIGSGPATYLREILKQNKNIEGYILDLPDAACIAKEFLKKEKLLKRVQFIEGDVEKVKWGGKYDIILISQVLHSLNPKVVKTVFKKAYEALNAGGSLYVHEFYTNEDRTFPQENVVFCLNMLLHSDGGNNFTVKELKKLYQDAGFKDVKVKKFTKPYTVMIRGDKR